MLSDLLLRHHHRHVVNFEETLRSAVRIRNEELHLTYVQGIERGACHLSETVLVALADALNVPSYVLLRPAKLAPVKQGRPRASA